MSHHFDPVCGKRMNVNKAHIVITHEGVDYYLCCPQCQKAFEDDPEKYVRNPASKKRR